MGSDIDKDMENGYEYDGYRYVCVFFILKPFFLPVGIQHNQCPCRFFNPTEIQVTWSQTYAREIVVQ